jgi:hypothetical protein
VIDDERDNEEIDVLPNEDEADGPVASTRLPSPDDMGSRSVGLSLRGGGCMLPPPVPNENVSMDLLNPSSTAPGLKL